MKNGSIKHYDFGECRITLEDDEGIEASDLADLLSLFRAVYAAGMQVVRNTEESKTEDRIRFLAEQTRTLLQTLTVSQIDDLFRQDLGPSPLLTERISHDSPFEIALSGAIILIAIAVVLSGGTVEFRNGCFKARVPPIGVGIAHLREALTSKTRAIVGYGVRSRTVKLSKEELAELMRHDPRKKDRGGFQRFLIGLQARVNRKTGRLELSEKDMDRIIRAGKNRTRGGFQRSIYKIFNRHFNFSEEP